MLSIEEHFEVRIRIALWCQSQFPVLVPITSIMSTINFEIWIKNWN